MKNIFQFSILFIIGCLFFTGNVSAQKQFPDTMIVKKRVTGFITYTDGRSYASRNWMFSVNSGQSWDYKGFRYRNLSTYLNKYPESEKYFNKCQRAATNRLISAGAMVVAFYGGAGLALKFQSRGSYVTWLSAVGISTTFLIVNHVKVRKNLRLSVAAYNREMWRKF